MRAKVEACLWIGRAIALVWLLSVTHSAIATTFNPKEMLSYRPFGNGEAFLRFAPNDSPVTVSELGPFAVVNYGRGIRCPGGGFYLVNTKRHYYQFIDAGSCDENIVATLTESKDSPVTSAVTHTLTFTLDGEIVARYPLYGY